MVASAGNILKNLNLCECECVYGEIRKLNST